MARKSRPFFEASRNKPEVIAHRGGGGQWPGETIFAFEQALKIGADVIEMDVRSTADDALVLIHNATLEETTNGQGDVHDHSLEQLKKLDAGFKWTDDGGKTFPFRGKNITVPTLEEVFSAFPGARMNIEIKQTEPSIVAPLARMIRDHGMTDRVLIAAFSDSALGEFRRICPEVATSASRSELIKFVAIDGLFHGHKDIPDTDAIQVLSKFSVVPVITERLVRTAHGLDLPIHAWTVNRAEEMQRMISLGLDGIITDLPGPLLRLLGRIA
jgi:glycerophosphoryl diester phosphodiesterase